MAFCLPVDVQLDCDNRTMLQPDVFVTCNKDKLKKRNVYGAPDFVVEILSPSTRRKDMTIKKEKYKKAGVREYWMVDIDNEKIQQYIRERLRVAECDTEDFGYYATGSGNTMVFVFKYEDEYVVYVAKNYWECSIPRK